MIRHCDGECGKHDCYVGFLEARLTEVERESDELRAEVERLSKLENSLPASLRDAHVVVEGLRDEVERLRAELKRSQDYGAGPTWRTHREALVAVAERQREADKAACLRPKYALTGGKNSLSGAFNAGCDAAYERVEVTPLVTEAQIFVEQTVEK